MALLYPKRLAEDHWNGDSETVSDLDDFDIFLYRYHAVGRIAMGLIKFVLSVK